MQYGAASETKTHHGPRNPCRNHAVFDIQRACGTLCTEAPSDHNVSRTAINLVLD